MFGKLLSILRGRPGCKARKRRGILLTFEQLETRLVPGVISTWNWKMGNADKKWSDPINWTAAGVPKALGDQATFDGTSVGDATVDIAVALDKLTITTAYTGTITVDTSLKIGNPQTPLTSSMANGILTGQGIEINGDGTHGGTFNWTGGTFQNTSQMRVDGGATWNITGAATKTLDSVLNPVSWPTALELGTAPEPLFSKMLL